MSCCCRYSRSVSLKFVNSVNVHRRGRGCNLSCHCGLHMYPANVLYRNPFPGYSTSFFRLLSYLGFFPSFLLRLVLLLKFPDTPISPKQCLLQYSIKVSQSIAGGVIQCRFLVYTFVLTLFQARKLVEMTIKKRNENLEPKCKLILKSSESNKSDSFS